MSQFSRQILYVLSIQWIDKYKYRRIVLIEGCNNTVLWFVKHHLQPQQQTPQHRGSNIGHHFRTNNSIRHHSRRTCLQRKLCLYRSLRLEIGSARLQVRVGWSGTIDPTHQPRARLLRCRTKLVLTKRQRSINNINYPNGALFVLL